uniref:Diterpene synthase-like protein n=1 Tax=Marchantia polymorpha TaxID=3197 RepID=A0A1L5YKT5_MARPO|nr:diterpene synthase-like protein [Marchantia polymorpha]
MAFSLAGRGLFEASVVSSSVCSRKARTDNCEQHPQQLRIPRHWTRRSSASSSTNVIIQCSRNEVVHPVAVSRSSSSDPSSQLHASRAKTDSVSSLSTKLSKIQDIFTGTSVNPLETFYQKHAQEMDKMKDYIQEIRMMFRSLSDGEISISPYDTAWVALVPALDGSEGPQFPKCLQWIADNQSSGGSWGDADFFQFYDRIINTLACIIALKTWDACPDAVEQGVKFIQANLHKLESEVDAHMPIGFEIVFPAMMKNAEALGLALPYKPAFVTAIEPERQKELKKIPMDIVHKYPTTLLHSLEGVHEILDWDKLLKLQSQDGSFLCSPASTACALMYTKDEKCLGYIEDMLNRFGNAVPNVYPVDLFEHMWMVDRIERLGIARYFEREIKDCLDYVYRFWTNYGLSWARSANVKDVDDTAMGFRLLRQHGYDVSADVFKQFRGDNGEFFCFAGQSGQAVTGMFNLYRAAQTRFPGETILEEALHFTRSFLEVKHAQKGCFDKWIITKDLEGEVGYALDLPWNCSLPRIETRAYLDHYGSDDIWIGKTLYRMPFVNNTTYLALAKADFNLCQSIHQLELQRVLRWNQDCDFSGLTFAKQRTYEWYFSAVTHLPAPELAVARLVWARNCVLTSVIRDFFDDAGCCLEEKRSFLAATTSWDSSALDGAKASTNILFEGFRNTVNAQIQEGLFAQDRDLGPYFRATWLRWVESMVKEAEWKASLSVDNVAPSFEEYLRNSEISIALEPVVLITSFFLGESIPDNDFSPEAGQLQDLMRLANRVGRLSDDIRNFKRAPCEEKLNAVALLMGQSPGQTAEAVLSRLQTMVDDDMLQLSMQVHQPSKLPSCLKHLHFNMARTMILGQRSSGCLGSLKPHIRRLLFEPVA